MWQASAAEELLAQFQKIDLPEKFICAGYIAIHDEINPEPILQFLSEQNFQLCLPVMVGENEPLIFREYRVGDLVLSSSAEQREAGDPVHAQTGSPRAARARMTSIPEPTPDKPTLVPDILLVPLLGFDRRGNRIGYGKGFYDRTLADLRAANPNIIAIGLAYAQQETHITPAAHDQPLNIIVTPREVIYCPAP